MKSQQWAIFAGAFVLCLWTQSISRASIVQETWESQPQTDPFTGAGDLTWTGDVSAWAIRTAAWPTLPAQDFAGDRSLRSANHGSTSTSQVVETVVTNISSAVSAPAVLQWSVFFSGNSIVIQPNRRADFILLADSSSVGGIEDPDHIINGYKLTLNDPYADAGDNIPPFSHEAGALSDSLTLWSVTSTDDRWRIVGSIPIVAPPGTMDIRDGWNISAQLDANGIWSIGFANGAIGTPVALTTLGMAVGGPALSSFIGNAYAGVGWTAPNNTTNDYKDFGFDNFSFISSPLPEPTMFLVFGLLTAGCVARGRNRA